MKKILSSLIIVLLMVFMFSGFASAAELSGTDIIKLVEQANDEIEQDIREAQQEADILTNRYQRLNEALKNTIELLPRNSTAYDTNLMLIKLAEDRYNKELDKIIEDLVETTNTRAQAVIDIAAQNGYKVVCEMVEVIIGVKRVLIDPMRVVDI